MATTDTARQIEAEDVARARRLVQTVISEWDWTTWDELLADRVVLSIKLGAESIDLGALGAVGGNLQVTGREEAKRILKGIYGQLRAGLVVTTEIVRGYDFALLGNLSRPSPREESATKSLPLAVYMAFDLDGRAVKMTIAAIDLGPLTGAILEAAEHGVRPRP